MKLKSSVLCGAAALSITASANATTISISDSIIDPPVVSGAIGTDYLLYQQQGSTLVPNNALEPADVLSGPKTQTSPGGNVRLYLNSYTDTLQQFNTANHVVLSGNLGSTPMTLSSLDGKDWFTDSGGTYNLSYGANNLANQWFNSFFATYNFNADLLAAGYSTTFIAAERQNLFTAFLNNPPANGSGFQHLSGTSISYVHEETSTNQISIGLADTDGYLYPLIEAYVASTAPNMLPYVVADGDIYASKAVLLSIDGGAPQALYSFSSVPSGLATTDGTNSYNLEFQVTAQVPEPAWMGLVLATGTLLLGRRRLTGQSVLPGFSVKVADRMPPREQK